MNLFQLKAYVLNNMHGIWSKNSSQALLESQIFDGLQKAEDAFLLNHPIRVLDDDEEHDSWKRASDDPLSRLWTGTITQSPSVVDSFHIKPTMTWTVGADWTATQEDNTYSLSYVEPAVGVSWPDNAVSVPMTNLLPGKSYTFSFIVREFTSTKFWNVEVMSDGSTIPDVYVGMISSVDQAGSDMGAVTMTFTPTTETSTLVFYPDGAAAIADTITIDTLRVFPTTIEPEYELPLPVATSSDWVLGASWTADVAGSISVPAGRTLPDDSIYFIYSNAGNEAARTGTTTMTGLTIGQRYIVSWEVFDEVASPTFVHDIEMTLGDDTTDAVTDPLYRRAWQRIFVATATSHDFTFIFKSGTEDSNDTHLALKMETFPVDISGTQWFADFVDGETLDTISVSDAPVWLGAGDQIGVPATTQYDGVADSAGMPVRWATILTVGDEVGGLKALTFTTDSPDLYLSESVYTTAIIAQVPQAEQEYPGSLRGSLAHYALYEIEQNADPGKAAFWKESAFRTWSKIARRDNIANAEQYVRGSSPYA